LAELDSRASFVIFTNTLSSIRALIEAVYQLEGLGLPDAEAALDARLLLTTDLYALELASNVVDAIARLWALPVFQRAYEVCRLATDLTDCRSAATNFSSTTALTTSWTSAASVRKPADLAAHVASAPTAGCRTTRTSSRAAWSRPASPSPSSPSARSDGE